MNHQPFENWLLSEEPLSPQNQQALDEHLQICEHCNQLQHRWSGVLNLFQGTQEVGPAPGFLDRWQETLEADIKTETEMRHRWQSWILLILITNAAAVMFFFLGVQVSTIMSSPVEFILASVYRFSSTLLAVNALQNIIVTMFQALSSVIPVGVWAAIVAGLGASTLVWIVSMTSFSMLRRRA
jgi:hypothetical protein